MMKIGKWEAMGGESRKERNRLPIIRSPFAMSSLCLSASPSLRLFAACFPITQGKWWGCGTSIKPQPSQFIVLHHVKPHQVDGLFRKGKLAWHFWDQSHLPLPVTSSYVNQSEWSFFEMLHAVGTHGIVSILGG